MRMGAFLIRHLQSRGPDYMVRAISRKHLSRKALPGAFEFQA
jgi:hypothetical protein